MTGPLALVGRAVGGPFESLAVRNYRLYFIGQVVSASGSTNRKIRFSRGSLNAISPIKNRIGISAPALAWAPALPH